MAKSRLPDLADDHRCTRNGTNWRCHLPRLPGKSYCQKHHLFNLARSQSRSKSKSQSQSQPQISNPNNSNLREIWAFHQTPYGGGAPRLYARVDRRIPNQSLVEVTPLLPHPDPTADVACGLFRPSSSTETKDMATFSHRVWFEVGGDGDELYRIFPRKGEIWAVEMYSWVEIVSSFGDGEGASGLVLAEEEEGGVFRRRLYEGCELIRRFSMEEMSMFLYRVSGARVVGDGTGLLLQGHMLLTEGEKEICPQRQETTCHQSEACSNGLKENDIEEQAPYPTGNEGENIQILGGIWIVEQAPDPIANEGENAQTLEGVSIVKGVDANEIASIITESVSVVEDNHQQ